MSLAEPKNSSLARMQTRTSADGLCLSCLSRKHVRRDGQRERPVTVLAADLPAGVVFERHRHDRAQLVYASTGLMAVTTADGTWTISPSAAVWIPPHAEHEIHLLEPAQLRTIYLDHARAAALTRTCLVLPVSALLRSLILRLIVADDRYDPSAIPAEQLATILVEELRVLSASQAPTRTPLPADRRLRALCLAFLENPDAAASTDDWAARFGMTRKSLTLAFRRELDMPFGSWRRRAIVEEASRRLATGQSVTQVAVDLGYESLSAFTAMFRRTTGFPPSKVRRTRAADWSTS